MKTSRAKVVRGFTLIETLIYIAIYSIIMAGALVSVYAILGSSARNAMKAMVQEEGSFLIGKIDWALTGAQSISQPTIGASGATLSTTKYDASIGNPIVISLSGGDLTISRGGNPPQTLNNSNVQVSCAPVGCFAHASASGDGINPESVSATITVHATTSEGLSYTQDFTTVKYLRK